ncbi:MAG: YdbL family protein [Pseudomonadota bacterium]|nr:YdbL family protein [Pseudomonadota bacterium]
MNKRLLTFAAAAGLAFAGLTGAVATAQNREPAALRASGQVGEQADGFMACVASCDAATRAAVNEINRKRAEAYREVAERTRVSEAAAAQAAGQRLIANLSPGQWYRPLGGGWTRK